MTKYNEHVIRAQSDSHGEGHDYNKGSPHLRHPQLRAMVEGRLADAVARTMSANGSCRVVEVGAGHGTFTHTLLVSGADVLVTEASPASARHLSARFGGHERLRVFGDPTGEMVFEMGEKWDLAVVISVLHHIPDYLTFLSRLSDRLVPGGGLITAQDPLSYPRMSRTARTANRIAYLGWRSLQGDYRRGLATSIRRVRGVYVDDEPSDLVEYHVVREGVDEEAVAALLRERFDEVDLFTYWSTQAPILQRLGARTAMTTEFGVEALGRKQ